MWGIGTCTQRPNNKRALAPVRYSLSAVSGGIKQANVDTRRLTASLVQQALFSVSQTHNAVGAIVDDEVAVGQMTATPTFPDIHESDLVALTGTDNPTKIQDIDNLEKYVDRDESEAAANAAQVLATAEGSVW